MQQCAEAPGKYLCASAGAVLLKRLQGNAYLRRRDSNCNWSTSVFEESLLQAIDKEGQISTTVSSVK